MAAFDFFMNSLLADLPYVYRSSLPAQRCDGEGHFLWMSEGLELSHRLVIHAVNLV
jgi:hypothetical protein